MRIFFLTYISSGDICVNDFVRPDSSEYINLKYLTSFSPLRELHNTSKSDITEKFSVVRMRNGEKYYIREDVFNKLVEHLKDFNAL